jgi:hypothetical protein
MLQFHCVYSNMHFPPQTRSFSLLRNSVLRFTNRAQQAAEAETAQNVAVEAELLDAEVLQLNRKQAALQHDIRLQKEASATVAEKLKR